MKILKTVGWLTLPVMLFVHTSCRTVDDLQYGEGPEPSGFSQAEQYCCHVKWKHGCLRGPGGGVCVTIRLNARADPRSRIGANLSIGPSVILPSGNTTVGQAEANGNAILAFDPVCVPCSAIQNIRTPKNPEYIVKMTVLLFGNKGTTVKTYAVPITQAVYKKCCKKK